LNNYSEKIINKHLQATGESFYKLGQVVAVSVNEEGVVTTRDTSKAHNARL